MRDVNIAFWGVQLMIKYVSRKRPRIPERLASCNTLCIVYTSIHVCDNVVASFFPLLAASTE